MTQLAIRGHATRGKEVIELLEMLGGKSYTGLAYKGEDPNRFYYINKVNNYIDSPLVLHDVQVFSLEEFLEKFPYKVGDKVIYEDRRREITKMVWEEQTNTVAYKLDDKLYCNVINKLQPYKKETMEEIKIDIPKGYEFTGIDDDNQQVVFTKIQPQYPKTYEECIGRLPINWDGKVEGYKSELLVAFQKLLIARDVYWKIAGEQMGLGKPWEPSLNSREWKFSLSNVKGNISFEVYGEYNSILCFPTSELRNTFYENFKDLIIECKELL